MSYLLEVCADSVRSAIAAQEGGADRVELCSGLVIGGLSPSPAMFREVKRNTDLKIRVLLRPRFGDFCYDEYEFQTLKEEVEQFRDLGADGVVIGILQPDGTLNMEQMTELQERSASRCTGRLMCAGILLKRWISAFPWGLTPSLQADRRVLPGRGGKCLRNL